MGLSKSVLLASLVGVILLSATLVVVDGSILMDSLLSAR